MTYEQFLIDVKSLGLTLAQLRCEMRPCEKVYAMMDRYEFDYEYFVTRMESQLTKEQSSACIARL
jgi:hypothetical protein